MDVKPKFENPHGKDWQVILPLTSGAVRLKPMWKILTNLSKYANSFERDVKSHVALADSGEEA